MAAAPEATAKAATASFQCSDSLFQYTLGGIGQSAIDVSAVFQTETGCGMG